MRSSRHTKFVLMEPMVVEGVLPKTYGLDSLARCLMVYDWEHEADASWLELIESIFSEFGEVPAEGTGDLGEQHSHGSYRRVRERLGGFLDLRSKELDIGIRVQGNMTHEAEGFFPSDIGIFVNNNKQSQKNGTIAIREHFTNNCDELVERIGKSVFEKCGACYGGAWDFPTAYDPEGYLSSVGAIPRGQEWGTKQVTKIIRAHGHALQQNYARYTYSANGQQITVKDANNNQTTYIYDGHDRLEKAIYPDSSYEAFAYDLAGNILSKRQRDGSVITYTYDTHGRLRTKRAGSDPRVQYSYDNGGRQTDIEVDRNNDGTYVPGELEYRYSYDDADRLIKVRDVTFGPAGGLSVTYTYNKTGCKTSVGFPSDLVGGTFYSATACDDLGRPKTLNLSNTWTSGGGFNWGEHASLTYDAIGRRETVTYPRGNGATFDTGYTYYNDDAVNTLAHGFVGPDYTGTYGYNDANQLTSEVIAPAAYNWDGFQHATDNYASNNLNQYTTVSMVSGPITNSVAPDYDGRGNLTAYGDETFTYDYENRLIQYTRVGSNPQDATYTYDAMGRRKTKVLNPGTAQEVTTYFLYDGDQVIAEYDDNTNLLRAYYYLSGGGIDEPILYLDNTPTSGAQIYTYHADGRGSIVAMSQDGVPTETYAYSTYGEHDQASLTTGQPYRYTGRRYDQESGLYYYRARTYHPGLGRFLQTDPIGYGDGLNMYAYVHNDPKNDVDPMGLSGAGACGSRPIGDMSKAN